MVPTSAIIEIISAPAVFLAVSGVAIGLGGAFKARRRLEVISMWKRSTWAMVDDPRIVALVVKLARGRYGIGVAFRSGEPVGESRAIAIFTRGLDLSEDDVETKIHRGYQVAYLKSSVD